MEDFQLIKSYSLSVKKEIIFEWKIEEFLNHIHTYYNSKIGKTFQSNCFPADTFRWYLRLYFNNAESENKEWISISTCCFIQMSAQCSIYILDNTNQKKYRQKITRVFSQGSETWNIPKFIEIHKLLEKNDKLLPNNDLTIVIKLTEFHEKSPLQIEVPTKTPKHQLTTDLKNVLESKAGSDVVLLVGDKKIPTHKFILVVRSPVFAAMFSHQLKENKENEIAIPDMDPEVCEKMLEYIYTENVTGLDGIAELLYEEADKYQLPALKELCEESFCKGVKVENSIKYLVLMDRHQADKRFFEFVLSFIAINSKKIVETADYKALEKTNPELLLTIVTKICSLK